MKCLRANNPGERDRYYDKAALARLDQEQGRVRVNAAEHQSMLYLITGSWLIEEAMQTLRPFCRCAGAEDDRKRHPEMHRPHLQRAADRHGEQCGGYERDAVCSQQRCRVPQRQL